MNNLYAVSIDEILGSIERTDKIELANRLTYDNLSSIKRSSYGSMYDHSLRVTELVISLFGVQDEDVIVAAILHDVVERSDLSLDEVKEQFGQNIANTVQTITRPNKTNNDEYIDFIISKIHQNLDYLGESKAVRMIKCADRIDNMRDALKISKNDVKYPDIPYWIIETKLSMLDIAKKTNLQAYIEMLKLVNKLHKFREEEVEIIVNNNLEFIKSDPQMAKALELYF